MRAIISLITLLASFTHSFSATVTPPANDNFADAFTLQETAAGFNATFLGSTLEPSEPLPVSNPDPISSIWWNFTPTETGSYSISAHVDSWLPYAIVKAYRGDHVTTLIPFQNHAPITPQNHSYFTLRATAGELIRIQVLHQYIDAKAVTVYTRSGPSNDDFQNAIPITNNITTGNTQGATSEFDEAYIQTVWHQWQPDRSRGYEFRVTGGHSLFIFEGTSLSNLKLVGQAKSTLLESFTATIFGDASKSYYIAVSGLSVFSGAFEFRINPGPANDMFVHRTIIQNLDEFLSADLTLATREPEEPSHSTNQTSRTVWYEWVAPTTGGHYIELTNATAGVSIYAGESLIDLTELPLLSMQLSSGDHRTNWLTFRALAGEAFHIAIHDDEPSALSFRIRAGPQNDEFANASLITLNDELHQSILGATSEPNEPPVLTLPQTVWHRFIAPSNGTYVAFTTTQREIAVFRGFSLNNLILAEPHSDLSSVAFPFSATTGETLFIAIAAERKLDYSLSIRAGPQNDNFTHRLPVISRSVITNSLGATTEPGEPTHTTNFTAGSLWWTWIPTNTGIFQIQAIVPHDGAAIAIYTGSALTNLNIIAGPEHSSHPSSVLLDLHAHAGSEYIIAVTYLPAKDTPLVLEIHTPPAHDSFSAPLPLTLNEPRIDKFIVSTREPGEGGMTHTGTLWCSWTAPRTAPYIFAALTVPDPFSTTPFVYTGSDLTNILRVPSFHYEANHTNFLAFHAQQEITYRFSVETVPYAFERTLKTTILPGHPHDDLANAASLSGIFVVWTNTMFGATSQPGEDLLAPDPSIWSQWIAPQSGSYKIVLPHRHRVGVYRGTSFTDIQPVAVAGDTNTTFNFTAQAGAAYQLRISATGAYANSPYFILRLGPVIPNETIATATELTGDNISVTAQNWTLVINDHASDSVWFKWTAPSYGLINFSSTTNTSIFAYHTKVPTLNSNLVGSGFIQGSTNSGTNGPAVTAGITYLFRLRTALSTNIPFNLQFEPKPVSVGALSGALLGGDALWTLQSNVFFSAPDALAVGPLIVNRSAFIELVIYGPGTLSFRTQIDSRYGSITVARTGAIATEYRGSHYWTPRTIELASSDYNVVRITMNGGGYSYTEKPAAWLDDIQFASRPPSRPRLAIFFGGGPRQVISLPVQAGRLTAIETSTNLTDWLPWTNILSPTSGNRQFSQPPPSNNIPQFFRARITP